MVDVQPVKPVYFRVNQKRDLVAAQNQKSVTARPSHYSGIIQTTGSGDSLVIVPFPVRFSEKPLLSYGFDVQSGDVTAGQLPTVSVGIMSYDAVETQPPVIFYVGATLGIVTNGPTGMVYNIHYHFDGVTIVNPISAATSLDSPI